jgi:hypothetical protein
MAKDGAIVIDSLTGEQSVHYYYVELSNTAYSAKKYDYCIVTVRGSCFVVRQAHHEGEWGCNDNREDCSK